MGSVDNWTDHTVDHQYTEYQKNTSAVVDNTGFLCLQYGWGIIAWGNHRENDRRPRHTCTYMELNKKENHSLYLL